MAEMGFNTERQREMADEMVTSTRTYLEKLDHVKADMEKMGTVWDDPQYEAFMNVFNQKYTQLSALEEDLRLQYDKVFNAADAGDQTTKNIDNIING